MKFLLAIPVAALLLLTACGQADNPFVGTWQIRDAVPASDEVSYLIVIKSGDRYGITVGTREHADSSGWGSFTRNGNELKAVQYVDQTGGPVVSPVEDGHAIVSLIDYLPATGRLTFKIDTSPVMTFSRVSGSTSIPTGSGLP
jgi:hypothetical protein